jgi:hypothetical protein
MKKRTTSKPIVINMQALEAELMALVDSISCGRVAA